MTSLSIANSTRTERARYLSAMRRQEVPIEEALRKPPPCIAAIPVIRVLEMAYFNDPCPKRLVALNEEAARRGLNAYLPVAALPLRGKAFFVNWTCENIIPMLKSRLRQQTTTQEVQMAQVIEQLPASTRAGRKAKYPYNEWLDGRVWQLSQGEDFEGEPETFTQGLRQAANSRNLIITAVRVEGGVAIQARPLNDEDKARREAIQVKRAATKAENEKVAKANGKTDAKPAKAEKVAA